MAYQKCSMYIVYTHNALQQHPPLSFSPSITWNGWAGRVNPVFTPSHPSSTRIFPCSSNAWTSLATMRKASSTFCPVFAEVSTYFSPFISANILPSRVVTCLSSSLSALWPTTTYTTFWGSMWALDSWSQPAKFSKLLRFVMSNTIRAPTEFL